ncbi:MAG: DapH/DapD/GlmU-related protein [Anaerolineales bacterium]
MSISLNSITALLKSQNLEFSVSGNALSAERLLAIAPQVKNALCYYVGNDPGILSGVESSIIFCKPGLQIDQSRENTFIYTEHPQLCFYHASSLFEEKPAAVIHSQAIINDRVKIGAGASIGPFCVIDECTMGENVTIDAGVKIYRGTVIGSNVQIQSNSVVGATGTMWAWDGKGNRVSCAQTGNVIIQDNVFIGSNITLVRGSFENKPTIIGRGTIMAHGTMIGHGTVIGERNHFANNVSIAGSVSTGENCFFGSGSIVRPGINIPNETIVGAGTVVVNDFLQEGLVLVGNPAREMKGKKSKVSGVPAPFSR